MPQIIQAHAPEYVDRIRELFKEYESSLGVSLSFQEFDNELAGLPGHYAPPEGRLYLALVDQHLAGCVGLRKISDEICELKRLYVRPLHRGQGIGRQLVLTAVKDARQIGYNKMRLDTLPSMKRALELYLSMGFKPIERYRANPVPGTKFLELNL
jgi:GNAT superfamily N-acetyltransferase